MSRAVGAEAACVCSVLLFALVVSVLYCPLRNRWWQLVPWKQDRRGAKAPDGRLLHELCHRYLVSCIIWVLHKVCIASYWVLAASYLEHLNQIFSSRRKAGWNHLWGEIKRRYFLCITCMFWFAECWWGRWQSIKTMERDINVSDSRNSVTSPFLTLFSWHVLIIEDI